MLMGGDILDTEAMPVAWRNTEPEQSAMGGFTGRFFSVAKRNVSSLSINFPNLTAS